MVCLRCKMVVDAELEKLGIRYTNMNLGEVEIPYNLSKEQFDKLDVALRTYGLELIVDKRAKLIEKIKNTITELIYFSDNGLKVNFSVYLSEHLNYDYTYLSNLFSEIHGTTIEQHFINQKIERVKELLVYNELNLSEIAWKLHYSSVQHLSGQFKKVTGITPTFFKHKSIKSRKDLNNM